MTTTLPPLTGAGGGAGSGAGAGAGAGCSTWGGSCGAGSAGESASSELGAGSVVGSSVGDGLGWADGDGTAEDRAGTVTGGPADTDAESLALAALLGGGDSTGAEQDAITRKLATAAIKATASRGVRALMVGTLPSPGRPSGT